MQHFKKKLKEDRTLRPCFEIDYQELVMEKKIGEGGFGLIYQARWRETTVAVKVPPWIDLVPTLFPFPLARVLPTVVPRCCAKSWPKCTNSEPILAPN